MRRPQSAKPGYKGYWGQGSQSQLQQQQNVPKGGYRKNVKLMKPELTTNDFARILPKKIYQDKQRLYSQGLQLKQNLNEALEQNIRLKTRITILEKQKDKMTKHLQINQQKGGLNKANSRANVYNNKTGEKENMMIRNLKKLVRQGKQENEFLKQENAKIKKAVKYTKINEIQIEKGMLLEENKRIAKQWQQMTKQLLQQEDLIRQISELKRKIDYQDEAYAQISEANQKYEEYVQELEQKRAQQNQKSQSKENRLQRELALNKRKLNEITRHAQELKKELNALRLGSSSMKNSNVSKGLLAQSKIDSQRTKLTRPMSSNPYKDNNIVGVRIITENKKQEEAKQNEELKNIQLQNEKLKVELEKTKVKLQQTQREMAKKAQNKSEQKKNKVEHETKKQQKRLPQNNFIQDKKTTQQKQSKSPTNEQQPQSPENKQFDDDEYQYYNDQAQDNNYQQNYQNEFQATTGGEKSIKLQSKISNPKQDAQIDKYRKDFQAEEEEEPLYVKEEKSSPKKKKQKTQREEKKKKDKKEKEIGGGYKPNKKLLSQMKQLLTYRMKAQRYPFQQLKKDIQSAKQQQFSFADLKGMFINQPFYLTQRYTTTLLQYCFQTQSPSSGSGVLSNSVLLSKLRKVIEDFELIEEKEQEQMLLRIAEMVTEYPDELETAFEKIKNGEQTVARQDLIDMFQNLQLEQKYIQLIIQQLSLCSADLQHLNFIGFFERFYVENMPGMQNGQIDEQQMESSSEDVTKHIKSKQSKKLKEIKAQFEDNDYDLEVDDGERISLGAGDKEQEEGDNHDVVSDDGPI